jgi:hypothetical protein
MITIESSWGCINTDDIGNILEIDVLEVDKDGKRCYLLDITKFDIEEWDKWYEDKFKENSPKPNNFDVLDLCYWTKDGNYHYSKRGWSKGQMKNN